MSAAWNLLHRFADMSTSTRKRVHQQHFHRCCLQGVPIEHLVITPNIQLRDHLPAIQYETHEFQENQFARIVRNHIPVNVRQQIEADDIQGAMLALGGTVDETHNIVDLVKMQIQERIRVAESNIQLVEHSGRPDARRLQFWQDKREQECRQLNEVQDRFQKSLEESCVICFEQPMTNPTLTKCHHMACLTCLLQWWEQSPSCPVCRTPMHTADLRTFSKTRQQEHKTQQDRPHKPVSRTGALHHLLEALPNDSKIAVFAEHNGSFDSMDRFERYTRLKGSSAERRKTLQRLKSGELRVLLLNSREDSAGIHLPELTDIILFHDMSDAVQTQAIGRGQRIGRQSPLHVHRFVPV